LLGSAGDAPGDKIPSSGEKIAIHTKPNALLEKAERPAHRIIPKSHFAKLETIEDVIQKLTGVEMREHGESSTRLVEGLFKITTSNLSIS
jgi:hypothetical protein